MRFVSTRDNNNIVGFKQAVLDCIPSDGGMYVPEDNSDDLRRWIYYADENTSFASLAGSLTSALINNEFSPIICEAIATKAFPFDPVIKQLDKHLFLMELNNGPTGTFKDYGVSYLTSALETILLMGDDKSILLDATTGELGACMTQAIKGKKLLKSVLLCPKGKFRGMDKSDFVWNGGNIYPVEVNGSEQDCHDLVRKIFSDRSLIEKYHLTVANTANIGRLLPQSFFYTYAFSKIKKMVDGGIYYAVSAGNYGNVVSGLYGWKMALPVNGFIIPSTNNITTDLQGSCMVLDSVVPLEKRSSIDPADPSNLERLERIFKANSLMLRNFIYPAKVTRDLKEEACRTLYMKYHVYADEETSASYAASLIRSDVTEDDEASVVLVARDHPSLSAEFITHNLGEAPAMTDNIINAFKPVETGRKPIEKDDVESLISILNSLNLLRLF